MSHINLNSSLPEQDRLSHKVIGFLPFKVEKNEQHLARLLDSIQTVLSERQKYYILQYLRVYHPVLFYQLMHQYLDVLLPVVYTPTVGQVVRTYSQHYLIPEGIHLSYPQRHLIPEILQQCSSDIKIIIISDGEGVLGIGDWGVGGIAICNSKKVVYSIAANMNPDHILAVHLDVGTNRETLRNDPYYLGWAEPRINHDDYTAFLDEVIHQMNTRWPKALIHWEDFSRDNGPTILNRYREKILSFNDDIQGTGAVACACILAGFKALGKNITEQNIVFFGAGSAGCGIANQWYHLLRHEGLSDTDAKARIWLVDRQGLLGDGSENMTPSQQFFSQHKNAHLSLLETIQTAKPAALIGCSGVVGAFSEEIITSMSQQTHQPIIMPLSNPTHCAEAIPENILHWSQGNALIATGSPFNKVHINGNDRIIAQCNNAYLFPGLALGALTAQAAKISDEMLTVSCHALANLSPILQDVTNPLLPDLSQLHQVTYNIAKHVAELSLEKKKKNVNITIEQLLERQSWLNLGEPSGQDKC